VLEWPSMAHPLQDAFDANEARRAEACPACGARNKYDWWQCACGLERAGWLTGPSKYSWAWACPKCGCDNRVDAAPSDAVYVPDIHGSRVTDVTAWKATSLRGEHCDGSCCDYVHP
jgi:predicted nucleic-acid-binding Zn-ribbon protein